MDSIDDVILGGFCCCSCCFFAASANNGSDGGLRQFFDGRSVRYWLFAVYVLLHLDDLITRLGLLYELQSPYFLFYL